MFVAKNIWIYYSICGLWWYVLWNPGHNNSSSSYDILRILSGIFFWNGVLKVRGVDIISSKSDIFLQLEPELFCMNYENLIELESD